MSTFTKIDFFHHLALWIYQNRLIVLTWCVCVLFRQLYVHAHVNPHDQDNSGTIDVTELVDALSALGLKGRMVDIADGDEFGAELVQIPWWMGGAGA